MYVGGTLQGKSVIRKTHPLLGDVSALPMLPALQSVLKGRLPVTSLSAQAGATGKKPGSAIGAVGIAVLGLLATAAAAVPTLYHYGAARESKSKMVKTTGYIMAGLGAAGVLGTLIGTIALVAGVASGEIPTAPPAEKEGSAEATTE